MINYEQNSLYISFRTRTALENVTMYIQIFSITVRTLSYFFFKQVKIAHFEVLN